MDSIEYFFDIIYEICLIKLACHDNLTEAVDATAGLVKLGQGKGNGIKSEIDEFLLKAGAALANDSFPDPYAVADKAFGFMTGQGQKYIKVLFEREEACVVEGERVVEGSVGENREKASV